MLAARTLLATVVLTATVATGCDLQGDRIGPEGGVIVSEDGRMALEIPEGALDEYVDLGIEVAPAPAGAAGSLYVIEPMGVVFERPAVLVYDYDDEMLGQADPEALSLVASREVDWAYLPDQLVDDEDQTVSATLTMPSSVTIFIEG